MKVGVLSQWFAPESGGATVPTVIARELVQRNHEVKVLTGFPNYPVGAIYPGYRQTWNHREVIEGADVRRVPLYPSHDNGAPRRAVNYLSFAASALAQAHKHLGDVNALWVYNSPASVPLVAARLARRAGVPYLLHIMDIWPDSVLESGMVSGRMGSAVERSLTRMVNRGYGAAARIGVIAPSQIDLLVERGVPRARLTYLPLCADEDLFHPRPADRSLLPPAAQGADVVLMYAGAMGHVQRLDTVVEAVAAIRRDKVHLVFVGGGVAEDALRARAHELRADNIHFLGRRPADEMGDLSAAADAHLVALADTPGMRRTMPSKIASILCSQRAIVATCAGDAASAIAQSEGGIVLSPGDVLGLRAALEDLASAPETLVNLGLRGHAYYNEVLSQRAIVDRVENELAAIAR